MNLEQQMRKLAAGAKAAFVQLSTAPTAVKDRALTGISLSLERNAAAIVTANKRDVLLAKKAGLPAPMIDRLQLSKDRVAGIAQSVLDVRALPDPAGNITETVTRPNGLIIHKVRVPIGVICVIYESRPNVTVDAAVLCLKSGNCCILRGGSEAIHSNTALVRAISAGLKDAGLPCETVSLVESTDRRAVDSLLKMSDLIDLVIPRGGESLITRVAAMSRIPVIKHYKGVCHVYVDKDADPEMAYAIILNAKVEKPGVCNAMESLLVHQDIAPTFLPEAARRLMARGVEIRGCPRTVKLVKGARKAAPEDWGTEYLDLILSVKVVKDIDEAILHIGKHGSAHSDAIVTDSLETSQQFVKRVDSAAVYVNASTRFTDGGEFGMGAEIGISTDRFHARGPMGLQELTTYKYVVLGSGQVR